MQRKEVSVLAAAALLLLALACGGGGKPTPTPIIIVITSAPGQSAATEAIEAVEEPAQPLATAEESSQPVAGVEVLDAVFAHGLTEEMAPVEPGSDFGSNETVYLSVELKGRPKEGQVTARFYWLDTFIADAAVDLADANSGVIFSVGENTYAGYTLSHDEAWPLGGGYRADLFFGDQALGSYPFRIAPPDGAIPSQIGDVVLALGADENYNPIEPTTSFAPGEPVYLVGRGDLGQETWIQADWYVAGQLDEAGTRSLTLEENASDAGFSFSYVPEAGWPAGEHYVVLTMDGQDIGRYPFTILSPEGAAPLDETG
jgi:hypothetical protein